LPTVLTLDSLEEVTDTLNDQGYVSDPGLSMSIFLALKMRRPLFLEGAPGVGKTEIARVLSRAFQTELIRLQCYEGLAIHHALYEWNYPRQLLQLQAGQGEGLREIYSDEYLLKRPLLQAIDPERDKAAVLLIDEIDRADEEFESFLLELLSDFQVTIPEIGRIEAVHRPVVILTSNRTREIHDALKRRCTYCWIDYPSFDMGRGIDAPRRRRPRDGRDQADPRGSLEEPRRHFAGRWAARGRCLGSPGGVARAGRIPTRK
jgi:MoxR-like ATPase